MGKSIRYTKFLVSGSWGIDVVIVICIISVMLFLSYNLS